MSEFGGNFKKAREARGVTLDQIALETRISTRFLQAIENEEFHVLPGGVFNRGFVRSFAEQIGLDPEQAIADYDRLMQALEPPEVTRAANPVPEKTDRHLYPIAIGALVALILIFYIVNRYYGSAQRPANETPPPIASAAPEQPQQSSTPAPPPPPPATPTVDAPPAAPLVIDVEARETTWISVRADGGSVARENLEPGMTRRYTAENSVNFAIGNAGGLVLRINGQLVQGLGRSGQVREFTVTPANVQDVLAGRIQ